MVTTFMDPSLLAAFKDTFVVDCRFRIQATEGFIHCMSSYDEEYEVSLSEFHLHSSSHICPVSPGSHVFTMSGVSKMPPTNISPHRTLEER